MTIIALALLAVGIIIWWFMRSRPKVDKGDGGLYRDILTSSKYKVKGKFER